MFIILKKKIISYPIFRKVVGWIVLMLSLLCLTILSLSSGVESIAIKDILVTGSAAQEIFLISRIPRTVSLILTGAGLSICGLILQRLAQNKFIAPSTSGSLDAAKLGVLFGLLLLPQSGLLTKLLFAVVICFILSAFFMLSISTMIKKNTLLIPVFGVMYGYLLQAITNLIGVEFNIIQNMEAWMLGNFAKSLKGQYELIYLMILLLLICYGFAHRFTIVSMGSDFTRNIGVNYRLVVNIGLLLNALMLSTSVLLVGAIPFIDLVIPNIVSWIHGDNLHKNLPYTACYGAIALLLCDLLARCIIFPYEMPTSMIVGSVGALFFLIVLFKKGR